MRFAPSENPSAWAIFSGVPLSMRLRTLFPWSAPGTMTRRPQAFSRLFATTARAPEITTDGCPDTVETRPVPLVVMSFPPGPGQVTLQAQGEPGEHRQV